MRNKFVAMIVLFAMLFSIVPAPAFADVLEKSFPDVSAAGYIVADVESGTVLFGKNSDVQAAPADLVKVMTAILAIESGNLDTEITVKNLPNLDGMNAVTVHLVKGERYTMRSLVEVMLVASAKDAAYVVAEGVAGSADKFVTLMNSKAKELGMSNTVFKNPHGQDAEGQLTTAADMAKLASHAMKSDTFRAMVKTQQVNWKGVSYEKPLANTNQLFSIMSDATGVQSGHTAAAKYTLIGSAKKDNRELVGVILGASDSSMYQNMRNILNYGFEHTKVVPVIQKDTLQTVLQFDEQHKVRVVAGENYSVILPSNNASIVSYQMVLDNAERPIKKNTQVGALEVLLDGSEIYQVPLIALEDARKPINWVFVAAVVLSLVYIASIISRSITMMQKERRKKSAVQSRTQSNVQNTASGSKNYDRLMTSIEHPTQVKTSSMQKKTLTSSRDRQNHQTPKQ
ncbi:MAG: D-alanyl-D-alanine carboxypeptidase [Peptococcaceae bacterium]|nr:D-alanyl-D-alanine carboxypeptidase [Peptococcaceae bacterium]